MSIVSFKINTKKKTIISIKAHFIMSLIVIVFLLLAGIKTISKGTINTEEMFTAFMMATTIFLPIVIIVLSVILIYTSLYNLKTTMLLVLLCLLIIGIQYDMLLFIIAYPIITLVVISTFITTHINAKEHHE